MGIRDEAVDFGDPRHCFRASHLWNLGHDQTGAPQRGSPPAAFSGAPRERPCIGQIERQLIHPGHRFNNRALVFSLLHVTARNAGAGNLRL